MNTDDFRETLLSRFTEFDRTLATSDGDWVVKGFIDVYKNIYTVSVDTKVISKIIELILFPLISGFAVDNGYKMVLSEHQNFYTDISFIIPGGDIIALDLKSTYRVSAETVNGFTLGAFTGYFRQRQSTKNITFPYERYTKHFVLGVIYSRTDEAIDERRVYSLDELQEIISVIRDFTFCFRKSGASPAHDQEVAIRRISAYRVSEWIN